MKIIFIILTIIITFVSSSSAKDNKNEILENNVFIGWSSSYRQKLNGKKIKTIAFNCGDDAKEFLKTFNIPNLNGNLDKNIKARNASLAYTECIWGQTWK